MTSPLEVWNEIRNAIEDRDLPRLANLCEMHETLIKEEFPNWRVMPDEVRQDRIQREAYAQSLVTLAQVFERAGKPELMQALHEDDPENPAHQIEDRLHAAKRLVNQRDFTGAISLLESMLADYADLLGPQVQEDLSRIQGLLGVTRALAGDLPQAILHTQIALNLCRELEDQEGIEIYTESLEKMQNLLEEG